MNKSSPSRFLLALSICIFSALSIQTAFSQPAPPPDPFLGLYFFENTNWLSADGDAPISFSNIYHTPLWNNSGMLIDTTNEVPAFLNYNVVETNGNTNITFDQGALRCVFISDWASADSIQNGSGLGQSAYLVAAGDFSSGSTDGLWGIYFDPAGTNIYFGGVSNSTETVFVSSPISWRSNSLHFIGLVYTSTNSTLYLDGNLAATGGAVSIVPSTNTWTNGFFVGSDGAGYEQARGVFDYLDFYNSNAFDSDWSNFFQPWYFTNSWNFLTNEYYTWSNGGGTFGPDLSGGFYPSLPWTNYVLTTNYLEYTNFWLQVTNSGSNAFVSLWSTLPGLSYEVLTNAHLTTTNWHVWQTNLASNSITVEPTLSLGTNDLFFKGVLLGYGGSNSYYPGPYFNGAPYILTQPVSQMVGEGSNATFSIDAVGGPPLSCQWTFDGNNIAGATASSYTISSVEPANVGMYASIVSNADGTATSQPAALTIALNPIMPTVRQAFWQGNVGHPGGIPYFTNLINVTNFGATGNGVSDDAPAINAAIVACTNGQVVYFPAGTYLISTNIIVNPAYTNFHSVVLRGAGPGLTTIELAAQDDEDVIKFQSGSAPGTNSLITNGLTQGSVAIQITNTSGFGVGDIISISQQDDTNFVTTNTYGETMYRTSAKYSGAIGGAGQYSNYGSFSLFTTNLIIGDPYLLALGPNDKAFVNGTNAFTNSAPFIIFTATATNATFYGTPSNYLTASFSWEGASGANPDPPCGYCGSHGTNCCQQYALITNISGNTLGITPPLLYAYSPALSPTAQVQEAMLTNCGIEDMTVARLHPSTNSYAEANCLDFDRVAWCWASNVETSWTQGAHVKLQDTFQCQVENCYCHDGWSQCSGQDYGIWSLNYNSWNLYENNIFYNMRHAKAYEGGTSGSVFAYNFITNNMIGESTTNGWGIADLFHGAHPWFNLDEGNTTPNIGGDFTHGSASHDTFFRDNIYLMSYAESNSLGIEAANWNSSEDPNGTQTPIGFPGAWIIGPMRNPSGSYGAFFASYNYYMSVVGCVFHTNSPPPWTYAVTNLTTNVSPSEGVIECLGFISDAPPNEGGPPNDGMTQSTMYWHGNYDSVSGRTDWVATNSDTNIPSSLYLSSAPAWWPSDTPWPLIGPDLVPMTGLLPAQAKFNLIR